MTRSISLQALLQQHLTDYGQHHSLDAHRLKVCNHLTSCQTPALGGMAYDCNHCDREVPRYHSCRDRHCPQCQQRATRQWCERQQQSVLPVSYYHLVFTLPHELNGWVQLHDETLYSLLFHSARQTLKSFGADKKRLNGKLGVTAVLHTWGQNLSQHVHLHCLVPGGALGEDQQWHAAKSNYLFPVKALSRHFRGHFVSALRDSATEGKLSRITNTNEVDKALTALMQKDWVVYSKHCLNHTDSIIEYLARYTHHIDRKKLGKDTIQELAKLKPGQTLLYFPEGTRVNSNGNDLKLKLLKSLRGKVSISTVYIEYGEVPEKRLLEWEKKAEKKKSMKELTAVLLKWLLSVVFSRVSIGHIHVLASKPTVGEEKYSLSTWHNEIDQLSKVIPPYTTGNSVSFRGRLNSVKE